MNIKIGPPVEGDDFFGRENELKYAWKMLLSGNNLVLPSPRRVGKTSFALKLLEEAKSAGWDIMSINLEKNTGEIAFIETFITELKKQSYWEGLKDRGVKFIDFLKQIKPTFEIAEVKISIDWTNRKNDVYEQLGGLLEHDTPTLIFMDELTVLLLNILNQENGHKNVSYFLHWMRELRIKSGTKIRWIFCSSVGIENFTHAHNLSATMNDLSEYLLQSFDVETSKAMIMELSNSNNLNLNSEIQDTIIKKISYCLPYFLQLMVEKINYLHEVEEVPVNIEIVNMAYELLTEGRNFNNWIERIDEQYGDLAIYTLRILRHVCQINEGCKRSNLVDIISKIISNPEEAENKVSKILSMLKNDGYLIEDYSYYKFRSPLLRDFWFKKHVK
jgi:uncharacterized protein